MDNVFPKLIYPEDYDPENEADVEESRMRGYLSYSRVVVNSNEYPVYFIDPIRLNQNLKNRAKHGKPCFAPVGLIVIDEVTPILMEKAIQYLWGIKYFTFFESVKGKSYQVLS